MGYELIIEVGENIWRAVDVGDAEIPMVFQINDLNQLDNRQASYSQTIDLPITPNNCEIFGYVEDFSVITDIPYIQRRCQLKYDGVLIISSDYRIELQSITDTFNCQIVSTVTDVISKLKALPMEDLGLERIEWTIDNIRQASLGNRWYKFPASVYAHVGDAIRVSENIVYQYVPHIPLLTLVSKAFFNLGYNLVTDIPYIEGYVEDYVALTDFKPDYDSFINNEKTVTGSIISIPTGKRGYLFETFTNNFLYGEISPMIAADPDVDTEITYGFRYQAVGPMSVRFIFNTAGISGFTNRDRVLYRISSLDNFTNLSTGGYGQTPIWETDTDTTYINTEVLSDEILLGPGQIVYIEAIMLSGVGTYRATCRTYFNPADNKVIPGGIINPNTSTTFKNQLEIIQLFGQLYGVSININEDLKNINATTFAKIRDNALDDIYVDWSEKVDRKSDRIISFRTGSYASVNNILKKENPVTKATDSGSFYVENQLLDGSKDLFTLNTVSADNMPQVINGQLLEYVDLPVYISDGDLHTYELGPFGTSRFTVPTLKYSNIGDVITQMQSNVILDIEDFRYVSEYDSDIPEVSFRVRDVARCAPAQYYVDKYYGALTTNILYRSRIIEVYVYLTPIDIQELDMLKPVYIAHYNEFFYIQKINNYIAGNLTKVTLACLNTTQNGGGNNN